MGVDIVKKIVTVLLIFVMSLSLSINVKAANNSYIAKEFASILYDNNIDMNEVEYVKTNITYDEHKVSDTLSTRIVTYEKIYRYIDNQIKLTNYSALTTPVYEYINNYEVYSTLFDKKTNEEHAKGYVRANFRYNSEYQEVKCLSTAAGEIYANSGYSIETSHRTQNGTTSEGGAYGEIKFKWGIWDSLTDKISIKCNYNGVVNYTVN